MSVYTTFTTITGVRISKENIVKELDYEELAEKHSLEVAYIAPMEDSDIIVGKKHMEYTDDGSSANDEELISEVPSSLEIIPAILRFTVDYNDQVQKEHELEYYIATYSFVSFG